MTRRKSLKGNRAAQRNFMAKELQKKQYHGKVRESKLRYSRKKEEFQDELDAEYLCVVDDCDWPHCACFRD